MKSTYKLFGTVWDGIEDITKTIPLNNKGFSSEAIVSLKALLSACNESEIMEILEQYCKYETIYICLDYVCSDSNPIIKAFIEKRTRQIIAYLSSKFKSVYCEL